LRGTLFFLFLFICIYSYGQHQILDLSGNWKFRLGDREKWSETDYFDDRWEEIRVPGYWEDQGFHGYDGYAWYRTKINGKSLPKNKTLYLHLGYIDDVDEVFVNGKLIGFTGGFPPFFKTAYKAKREYLIPKEFINFNGENTIAVRVFDIVLEGGIVNGNIGIYTQNNNARLLIDLQGLWSFKTGRGAMKNQNFSSWDQIMGAIPWEAQGYNKYDGYAWYRKSFYVPEEIPNEDLVLLLGRIDDFDETYLNEEIIGETRDAKPFGMSLSYRKMRVYDIPNDLIKRGSENVITIIVEDLGGTGGMWEGPVGITTRSKYNKFFR